MNNESQKIFVNWWNSIGKEMAEKTNIKEICNCPNKIKLINKYQIPYKSMIHARLQYHFMIR